MNIYDMIPGRQYLIGDSLGYDLVECVKQNVDREGIDIPCVLVRFIKENNREDYLFEAPDCGFSTYVEPR